MLYYNNRPVTPARRSLTERFFQWRTFKSDTQELREKIEADFQSVKSDTRQEKYFLIPGRERSISTSFPLKRTTSATIGSAIPRFRGSLNSVMTADSLTESLQRKSKYFEAKKSREVFKNGKVTAEISEIEVDGQVQYSIALQSEDKEAILDIIKAYGLKQADNTNIADHLLTA